MWLFGGWREQPGQPQVCGWERKGNDQRVLKGLQKRNRVCACGRERGVYLGYVSVGVLTSGGEMWEGSRPECRSVCIGRQCRGEVRWVCILFRGLEGVDQFV